jgi:hypothetical protein
MKHKLLIVLSVLTLVQLACGPLITVTNSTSDNVRVMIKFADGSFTVSPAPFESKEINVKVGSYTASAVSGKNWDDLARKEQQNYVETFKDPKNMTKDQIEQAVDSINTTPERLSEMFQNSIAATCTNNITTENDGVIEIVGSVISGLSLHCSQVEAEDSINKILYPEED